MEKILTLHLSYSRLLAISIACLMYVTYAAGHTGWLNPVLLAVCLVVGTALPIYSKMSNRCEEIVNLKFALVTLGRLARFSVQAIFNIAVFVSFDSGGVLTPHSLDGLGGPVGAALLTTAASQGAQYIAVFCFNRGIGDLNRNVMLALSANVLITACATFGFLAVKLWFVSLSCGLGALVFGIGLASDIRAILYPRGGVGIFFGTFNPFHVTHLEMIKTALAERQLSRVIIHPTIVPKLHQQALARGEIKIARIENGMYIFEKTARADPHVQYFPTGNRFFTPEARKLMIELALEEAGLQDRVEVMWLPNLYQSKGFHGVVTAIARRYPNDALHGIHGSDLGGIWVRNIYDESGWIYPMPFVRKDGVSATAIRNGASGMTARSVTDVLERLRANVTSIEVSGRRFNQSSAFLNQEGV